jgi:hypothetical protein
LEVGSGKSEVEILKTEVGERQMLKAQSSKRKCCVPFLPPTSSETLLEWCAPKPQAKRSDNMTGITPVDFEAQM